MDVASNWWENFFHGVAVDMWMNAVSSEQTRGEAAYVARALRAAPGAELLDVPCGGGRMSVALSARGYRMTGVDLSPDFLNHARAADSRRIVAWEQRDMRDLPWPARFDGALCCGNSFGYLDDEGNAAFLRAVAAALKPGARFFLDAPSVVESVLRAFDERFWVKTGDVYFMKESAYDHASGRILSEYTFARSGSIETRRASYRVYTYRQIVELLGDAGFEIEAAESWTRERVLVPDAGEEMPRTEPYRVGARSLMLTARRRAMDLARRA
jgi:SAM-dependent methyltransferase